MWDMGPRSSFALKLSERRRLNEEFEAEELAAGEDDDQTSDAEEDSVNPEPAATCVATPEEAPASTTPASKLESTTPAPELATSAAMLTTPEAAQESTTSAAVLTVAERQGEAKAVLECMTPALVPAVSTPAEAAKPVVTSELDSSSKVCSVSAATDDFSKGDTVTVDGRIGIVHCDLRPSHQFAQVKWDDDGTISRCIRVTEIKACKIAALPDATAREAEEEQF